MKAAVEEELLKGVTLIARQRIIREELIANALVGLKHAPRVEGAHVELTNPGVLEDRLRQGKAQLGMGQGLSNLREPGFMLLKRELLQHRNDAIKRSLDLLLVALQLRITGWITQGVLITRPNSWAGSTRSGVSASTVGQAAHHGRTTARSRRCHGALNIAATGTHQPRAPPETVMREPLSVLPLEPVTGLTGKGTSSLRFCCIITMAFMGPTREGLRRRAEAPSVPVT